MRFIALVSAFAILPTVAGAQPADSFQQLQLMSCWNSGKTSRSSTAADRSWGPRPRHLVVHADLDDCRSPLELDEAAVHRIRQRWRDSTRGRRSLRVRPRLRALVGAVLDVGGGRDGTTHREGAHHDDAVVERIRHGGNAGRRHHGRREDAGEGDIPRARRRAAAHVLRAAAVAGIASGLP